MRFGEPLGGLARVPFLLLLAWHLWRRRRREPVFVYSRATRWAQLQGRRRGLRIWVDPVLRAAAVILVVLALMRPQGATDERETERETVDMVLCMDISGSLQARDLKHDRLEASKEVAREFVSRRAEGHAKGEGAEELRQRVRTRARDLLDAWDRIAHSTDGVLQYAKEVGQAPPLLHEPLDPELRRKPKEHSHFKASRSLRDVEPTVNLWIRTPDDLDLEERR